jgi:hypothetical protein
MKCGRNSTTEKSEAFQLTFDAKDLWGGAIVCLICGVPLNMEIPECCEDDRGVRGSHSFGAKNNDPLQVTVFAGVRQQCLVSLYKTGLFTKSVEENPFHR